MNTSKNDPTPDEYRAFCASMYCAPDTVDRDLYVAFLLEEETGEVAKLFAKAIRDNGHVVDHDKLKDELGDVLWCSSFDGKSAKVWPVFNVDENPRHTRPVEPGDIFNRYGRRRRQWYYGEILRLMQIVRHMPSLDAAARLCAALGFEPADVAAHNVAKLKDRKARNVIKGAGDGR